MRPAPLSLARASTVLGLSAVYIGYVFQLHRGTFLTAGLGDWIDPYFINYLLEHWYRSVVSLSDPASPRMFFPEPHTLGYSHGLILFAPYYIPIRPFLHPFQAEVVALVLVMEIGVLALYYVLRRFVALGFIEALLLTAFFASSGNVVNGMTGVWLQRASVFLIPPILLVTLISMRLSAGRRKLALGFVSGLLWTLLFTQDFYTAQLGLLVSVLFLAGALPFLREPIGSLLLSWRRTATAADAGPTRRPSAAWLVVAGLALAWALLVWLHPIPSVTLGPLRLSAENYRRPLLVAMLAGGWYCVVRWQLWTPLARLGRRAARVPYACSLACGAIVGAIVFFWIYLGVYLEGRVFPADQLAGSLHSVDPTGWRGPFDVMNGLLAYDSSRSFVLVAMTALVAWLPISRVPSSYRRYAAWSAIVAILVLALSLRIDGFSPWVTFLAWMPGFSSIRDPKRIIYPYELAVVVVTALLLRGLPSASPLRRSVPVLLVALMTLDWNREVFEYRRPLSVHRAWVEAPIAIDPSCATFYVRKASPAYMSRSGHMASLYGIDSAFIALNHRLPTLNGYSAWEPLEWGMGNPQDPGYDEAVAHWMSKHQLTAVCELDIEARTMRPSPLVTGRQ